MVFCFGGGCRILRLGGSRSWSRAESTVMLAKKEGNAASIWARRSAETPGTGLKQRSPSSDSNFDSSNVSVPTVVSQTTAKFRHCVPLLPAIIRTKMKVFPSACIGHVTLFPGCSGPPKSTGETLGVGFELESTISESPLPIVQPVPKRYAAGTLEPWRLMTACRTLWSTGTSSASARNPPATHSPAEETRAQSGVPSCAVRLLHNRLRCSESTNFMSLVRQESNTCPTCKLFTVCTVHRSRGLPGPGEGTTNLVPG